MCFKRNSSGYDFFDRIINDVAKLNINVASRVKNHLLEACHVFRGFWTNGQRKFSMSCLGLMTTTQKSINR